MNRFISFLVSPLFLLILTIALIIHQYIFWGVWFETGDIHHEVFIIAFAFAVIVSFLYRKRWY